MVRGIRVIIRKEMLLFGSNRREDKGNQRKKEKGWEENKNREREKRSRIEERERDVIRDHDVQSWNDRKEEKDGGHHRKSRNISPKKMIMVGRSLDETHIGKTHIDVEMEKGKMTTTTVQEESEGKSEDYRPFRKKFYVEAKEISNMTCAEVSAYREKLGLTCFPSPTPNPIFTWHQAGLPTILLDTLKRLDLDKPLLPIQAQALPVIMSGQDCLGLYRTGPGKTLAFVLPMLTHIKDQPPLVSGDGPIGLIMAPTRAAVRQIHNDILKFTEPLALTCVPLFGGRGLAQQIDQLKLGAEIVVCTPDIMMDILCSAKTAAGQITNLRRVTYLVVDETDRIFDMGFGMLMTCIFYKTRPNRQIVMFSDTSLHGVDDFADDFLTSPVLIKAGRVCFVNENVRQLVEVRPEDERFLRLLQLLGEWYDKGKILLCVESLDKCAALSRYLYGQGYPCLCLYDEDQKDFESVIFDLESKVFKILVTTSDAALGLEVKELELVIHFDVPKHYGNYVHCVGLAGRPGKKGLSIAFISKDEARYAPILASALTMAAQVQRDDLKALAEQARREGYYFCRPKVIKVNKKPPEKSFGFKWKPTEVVKAREKRHGSEDVDDGVRKAGGSLSQQAVLAIAAASEAMEASSLLSNTGAVSTVVSGGDEVEDAMLEHYEAELDINDLPMDKKWRVTQKDTLRPISAWSGAAITVKGQYFPPGKILGPCDRKLYLFIEGTTEQSVKTAKIKLKKVLENMPDSLFLDFKRNTGTSLVC